MLRQARQQALPAPRPDALDLLEPRHAVAIDLPEQPGRHLAPALDAAVHDIRHCERCHTFTENALCDVCADPERDAGVLCIVEVRMRSTAAWGDPALTVLSKKRHKVAKAALYYLQRERLLGRHQRRRPRRGNTLVPERVAPRRSR